MARDHGTQACYTAGCRRDECRIAHRDKQREERRLKAYGRWESPFTDAEPARKHLLMLSEHGIGLRRSAELAGISHATMTRLIYGEDGAPPAERIRFRTEAAIFAVQPSGELVADGVAVPGCGPARRVQALIADGWSQKYIEGRVGMYPGSLAGLLKNGTGTTLGFARKIAALYDELWNTAPSQETATDRRTALRSRRMAERQGWLPWRAWDDESIDDPTAEPDLSYREAGRKRKPAVVAAEAREMLRHGAGRAVAAERLGISRGYIDTLLVRFPEPGEEIITEQAS
jgi:transcriptional regulator with XRE-family HTH domain